MSVDLLEGTMAAPPRDNGELVFAEPWQARAFGLATDLANEGHFTWDEFREQLVAAIAAAETAAANGATSEAWNYYQCWLIALEQAVTDSGLVEGRTLADRAAQYAERPSGHDH